MHSNFPITFFCLIFQNEKAILESLEDVTSRLNVKTSSHAAIAGSLVDGSTETFWESGNLFLPIKDILEIYLSY